MRHIAQLAFHGTIPVVLDGIICSSLEDLGNLSPLVLELAMHHEEYPFFFFAPPTFFYFGVQVVMPSLATLLPNARGKIFRYHGPFLSTDSLHQLD